jgi:hypothetical protein
MGQRLLITEAEKITIQHRYGMNITLLEQSDKFSKEEILQRLNNTFNLGPKTKRAVSNAIENNFGTMSSKALLSIILPLLINMTSCQNTGGNTEDCDTETQRKLDGDLYEKYKEWDVNNDSIIDDVEIAQYSRDETQRYLDSAKTSDMDKRLENSKTNSGVEILNVKFVNDNDYSDYKNIKITYKNNTGKNISAISFKWYDLKDVFDEDVESTLSKGGYDSDGLKKGRTTSGTWELKETKVKSGKVYVDKIMFDDGSKWLNDIN